MNENINFIKEEVVLVSEQNKNKKLGIFSFVFFIAALFLATIVLVVNIIITNAYNREKQTEDNLISQISSSDNRKKETLFFLIKNRIVKFNSLDNLRIEESRYLENMLKLNGALKIDRFKLAGRGAEVVFKISDYPQFETFLDSLEDYEINRDTVIVSRTHLLNGTYEIALKFAFK